MTQGALQNHSAANGRTEIESDCMSQDSTRNSSMEVDDGPRINAMGDVKSEPISPGKRKKDENGSCDFDDNDDIPWAQRIAMDNFKKDVKDEDREYEEDDDIPWAQRMAKEEKKSVKKEKKDKKRKKDESESDRDEYKPEKKKDKKKEHHHKKDKQRDKSKDKAKKTTEKETPKKREKKEEQEEVWEWWKEEKKPDGVKWNSLTHNGPLFAPAYEPLPSHVKFYYDKKCVKLSKNAEEVATFYGRMIDHEYTTMDAFNKNFMHDWRKVMEPHERELIADLRKCDFKEIDIYFKEQSEKRKAMTKEEKNKIKEEKEGEGKIYGYAFIDGHKQKIGNFRIEPPGLFRGRGGHPKMGRLKKRIQPEDVIINCGKDSEIPTPPPGHRWKEVRHDNTVTWLCSWTENVLGQNKYIMLNPSSKIKGEKDYEKFETARRLKNKVANIREVYRADWKSKEMRLRQRAVALYFIDKLALRAGNEKDTEEAADTVGCCSLRCEHIKLHEELDGKEYVVEFDFLGKDSIRYYNKVPVEKQVFKNLKLFKENKEPTDDLFDRLDTSTLNTHLSTLMPGLTVKVFRTYNASITLQQQLDELTNPKDTIHQKLLSYNRANRQVAILCNHQRAVPKGHDKSMENLDKKISDKKAELKEAKAELEKARGSALKEKLQKKVDRLKEQYKRLKINRTDKDENKQIALGTSKLNYLDPRISVAWCKKHEVPIEKIFNKTQREKFRWAIDMGTEEYVF